MPRPDISRIVHLQGGLRAVDVGSDRIFIQAHGTKRFLHFPTPEYADLYASLQTLGFRIIGVEFVANRPFSAPDWSFTPPEGRFKLMEATRAWSEMRYLARKQRKFALVDISRRCTASLELLGLRLLQMSNAYSGTYLAQAGAGDLSEAHLFDNTYTHHIEAAIHAFLADAINLRNFMFEFVWAYVLREPSKKPTLKELRAKAQSTNNHFALSMVDVAESGWLKRLSELRDGVFHFAPIGARHALPLCHTREVLLPDGGRLPYVSYGLLDPETADSVVREADQAEDSEVRKSALMAYKAQLDASPDALEYCWRALGRLIALSEEARVKSKLQGEMPSLGPNDIIS